jgi:hypothetical protein
MHTIKAQFERDLAGSSKQGEKINKKLQQKKKEIKTTLYKLKEWHHELGRGDEYFGNFEDLLGTVLDGKFPWHDAATLGGKGPAITKALELWHRRQRAEEELILLKQQGVNLLSVLDAMAKSTDDVIRNTNGMKHLHGISK